MPRTLRTCNILSVLCVFKCKGKQTTSSFLSSDITPTSAKETESNELLYTVRSLVTVREPVASAMGRSRRSKSDRYLRIGVLFFSMLVRCSKIGERQVGAEDGYVSDFSNARETYLISKSYVDYILT